MWSLGLQAASALAIGLGAAAGRRRARVALAPRAPQAIPRWRAFAAFTGAAIVTVWTYTAVKAAFLSTVFATRVEERNLIYLGPLLIVGTVVWLGSRARGSRAPSRRSRFTAWLVLHYGYQLDYPYFEAPGYGIATMANRAWYWDQPTIRLGLDCRVPRRRSPSCSSPGRRSARRAGSASRSSSRGALTLTWMLAGADHELARRGRPVEDLRRSTCRSRSTGSTARPATAGTTYIGQDISAGQALGIDLLEFWNRSVKNVWSLDGSAPGPGPGRHARPGRPHGTLHDDPGLPYVLATDRVNLVGPIVATRPGLTLRRIDRAPVAPARGVVRRLGRRLDPGSSDGTPATGTYAYFGPERTRGTLTVDVSRAGFCAAHARRRRT